MVITPPVEDYQGPTVPEATICSAGIMAYNEADNIATAVRSLLTQRSLHSIISEIIVVASGCTDDTVPIVSALAEQDSRVRLIAQEEREGKASAINLFLQAAKSPILFMTGGDVVVKDGTVDAMVSHFSDPTVGMVGAHPIPVNNADTFLGHTVHLLWALHDAVARRTAKLGEAIAIRNVVPGIPVHSAVDEISMQALITQLGYRLVYEPAAIIYNRGPANVGDFLRQRRRIHAGHLRVRRDQHYTASTMNAWRIAWALCTADASRTWAHPIWTCGAIGLEAWARALGRYDQLLRRPHTIWQLAQTTKANVGTSLDASGRQSVLVFHIAGYHEHELELGTRASQLLQQQVSGRVRQALGRQGDISKVRGGTIIAQLHSGRADAEQAVGKIVESIQADPLRINFAPVEVKLRCGVIAFEPTEDVVATTLPRKA